LYYNYYRYYGPGIGRYLEVDPLGIQGDEIISKMPYHLYLYSDNSPTNKIDPKGQVAVHGNFCGPKYGDLLNDRPWKGSKDGGVDRCCYKHDLCYKNKGVKPPYGQPWCNEDNIEQLSCDRKMCVCLRKAKPPAKYLHIKYAMQKTFGCIKPGNLFEFHF
jgi:RHS repeat-associated protein